MRNKYCIENDFAAQKELAALEELDSGAVGEFNEMPRAVKPSLYKFPQEHPGDFDDPRPGSNGYGVVTEHDLD